MINRQLTAGNRQLSKKGLSLLPTREYEFVVKVENKIHGPTGATEKNLFGGDITQRLFFFFIFLASLFAGGTSSMGATSSSSNIENEVFRISNVFEPHSVPAHTIYNLSLLVLAICTVIFILVTAILIFVVVRYRRRTPTDTQEPPQIYGSSQIELAWTIIPILITIVLILATARTIGDIQDKKLPEDALTIKIVGHQWWWEVRYPQYGFVTANEIHVPVSSSSQRLPTRIILESADVLHSFWVPQLAGKMQLVPNKTNTTWIEPLKTGVYLGNCAQYCGTQHAFMLLRVVVHTPEEFQQWVANQKNPAQSLIAAISAPLPTPSPTPVPSPMPTPDLNFPPAVGSVQGEIEKKEEPKTAYSKREKRENKTSHSHLVSGEIPTPTVTPIPPPTPTPLPEPQQQTAASTIQPTSTSLAAEGQKTFTAVACVNCHRIDGTSAQGVFGPDLTHFMSRQTLGAGIAANTHKNLWQWIRNPQILKIGCLMPDMQLTDRQVDEIVAYLETLK